MEWFDLTASQWNTFHTLVMQTGSIQMVLQNQLGLPEEWGPFVQDLHRSNWPQYLRLLAIPILEQRDEVRIF